jgi:predicted transcriptional regulator
MTEQAVLNGSDGDAILQALTALASPQRLRIVAGLVGGRKHVSQLARELRISRPLLYLHLQKLDAAGLVHGHLELSDDGKALKYFEVSPFAITVTPESIVRAVATLSENRAAEQP